MTLLLNSSHTYTTTYRIILLCQVSLALALPAGNSHRAGDINARDVTVPNLSGAAGKIAGGVFALVLLSLGLGVGAASIAILGSTEWREFRDRKKPQVPARDGVTAQQGGEQQGVNRAQTDRSESTVDENEKATAAPARRPRLTLKSLMPIDFNDLRPGWLTDSNKR